MFNRVVFAAAFTLATAGGAAAQTPAGDPPTPQSSPPRKRGSRAADAPARSFWIPAFAGMTE